MNSPCDMPPEWAIERAQELFVKEMGKSSTGQVVVMIHAFARYIASKEEAPVDPLVLEARNICVENESNFQFQQAIKGGNVDGGQPMRVAIAALKRGMELAKEQSNG